MRVSSTITIRRPIRDVFGFVSDPECLSTWALGATQAGRVRGGVMDVGAVFGEPGGASWEIVAYEPPCTIAYRALDDAYAPEARLTLEATCEGTRLRAEADMGECGLFGAGGVQVGEALARLAAELGVLRDLMEGRA